MCKPCEVICVEPISVRMLGEFSLSAGENKISDSDNRARNVWLLLACLLCHRHRLLSQDTLIDLLYGEEPKGVNPASALKTTLHRARALLDQLWPGAGHELILRREGGYCWNDQYPVTLDFDRFDRLCQSVPETEDEQLACWQQGLALYRGEFLNKLSTETWVLPHTAYFHNLYIQTVLKVLPLLTARGRVDEAETLCRAALGSEPYHEVLHCRLMRILLDQGRQKDVVTLYETLSQRLFEEFGIMPSEDIHTLYREAVRSVSTRHLPMEAVLNRLKEPDGVSGALVCEYDYFVVLCRSEARSMARDGKAAHIALLSVSGADDEELPKRSLDRTMDNLEEQIRTNLRRGDALTRCSVSQFLVMLPHANYEDSCMVCRRVISAFGRRYPHSPAKLRFTVQPLEPNL